MKDKTVVVDTNVDQVAGSGRTADDISFDIMGRHRIAQRMVDVFSCEAMLSRTLQEPHDGKLCFPHSTAGRQRLLSTCWSSRPRTVVEPSSGCQWLLASWDAFLFGTFPGTLMCPCRGGRTWEGGEGRVQAERSTCQSPQGQGNSPIGERRVLTAVARLIRAVGVLVDALSKWIG